MFRLGCQFVSAPFWVAGPNARAFQLADSDYPRF